MLLGVVEVLALHGTDELVDVIAGCVADVDGDAAQTAWRGLDALFAFDNSHRDSVIAVCPRLLQRMPRKWLAHKTVQVLCQRGDVNHMHRAHVFVQVHVKKVCLQKTK